MAPPEVTVFTSRRCLAHRAPGGYPERPERLASILERLRGARLPTGEGEVAPEIVEVDEHPAAAGAVAALHDPEYVERFRAAAERGDGLLDSPDNPLSAGTWEAAWAAVAAALAAADRVAAPAPEGGRLAVAAVRPPGHHAERDRAMGFCFFNNAAVAADYLARGGGEGDRAARRVAVYDLDVHHGNGTQHLFEARADVLYASSHQFPFYPGTGAASEVGVGEGRGATVNLPLAAGTDGESFLAAVAERIEPALAAHRPEVLVLSAGFDAWLEDPLGGLALDRETFRTLGRRLGRLAADLAGERGEGGGRVLVLLEGGYDLGTLPELVELHLAGLAEGLAGARPD